MTAVSPFYHPAALAPHLASCVVELRRDIKKRNYNLITPTPFDYTAQIKKQILRRHTCSQGDIFPQFLLKERLVSSRVWSAQWHKTAIDRSVHCLWHLRGFIWGLFLGISWRLYPIGWVELFLYPWFWHIWTRGWNLCLPRAQIKMLLPSITAVSVCIYEQDWSDLFTPGGVFLWALAFHCSVK